MKQQTLAMATVKTFENYRKPTRRAEFQKTMAALVPWAALYDVIRLRIDLGREPVPDLTTITKLASY